MWRCLSPRVGAVGVRLRSTGVAASAGGASATNLARRVPAALSSSSSSCTCHQPFSTRVDVTHTPSSSADVAFSAPLASPAAVAAAGAKAKKGQMKVGRAAVVNVAASLKLPSPSADTAPFPSERTTNDTRDWRPRRGAASRATVASMLNTPIFYANGSAHIGHLSTTLLLDALNRWNNIDSTTTDHHADRVSYLVSGTDEHGSKVAESASRRGVGPSEHVRSISHSFHELFASAHIHLDDYVRTTESRHYEVAQAVWARLHELGYIYLGQHAGHYSKVDECFIPDSQVESRTDTTTGTTITVDRETGHRVEFQSEKNYKFRLSAFRDLLIQWVADNTRPPVIEPPTRRKEILTFLQSTPLEDISVSRLRTKVEWGVPLPPSTVLPTSDTTGFDGKSVVELAESADEHLSHVMYVWLDALSNYLTVSGITPAQLKDVALLSEEAPLWPPQTQLIGKDILRFHTIYWPAFLIALNLLPWKEMTRDASGQIVLAADALATLPLALPRRVVAHAHWLVERTKMSKSLGNVIDPVSLLSDFGVDPVRYFLLRDSQLSDDANFSAADVVKRLHADLADTFGNLLNRCIGAALLPANALPTLDETLLARHPWSSEESVLIRDLDALVDKVRPSFQALRFGEGLQTIFTFLYRINAYVDEVAPWKLRKEAKKIEALGEKATEADRERRVLLEHTIDKTLYLCLESLRCVAILLQPVMPDSMAKLMWRLAVKEDERRVGNAVSVDDTLARTRTLRTRQDACNIRCAYAHRIESSSLVPCLLVCSFGRAPVSFPSEAPSSAASSPSPLESLPSTTTTTTTTTSAFLLFQKLEDARVLELVVKYGGSVEQVANDVPIKPAANANANKQTDAKKPGQNKKPKQPKQSSTTPTA